MCLVILKMLKASHLDLVEEQSRQSNQNHLFYTSKHNLYKLIDLITNHFIYLF